MEEKIHQMNMPDVTRAPKVSVSMRTYNHEKFIARAIDSVLAQKVDFDYEIIIGEDASTDGTRKIVTEYRKQYPDRFRLLLPDKNIGRRNNFIQTIRSCRGQYIALLDGDDYWNSPFKLQRLADFLDNNSNCSICYHDVCLVSESAEEIPIIHKQESSPVLRLQDLLRKNFIATCSVMLRNDSFDRFPACFDGLFFSDWPLYIVYARRGDIGYIDEVMGAARIYGGGIRTREYGLLPELACLKYCDEDIRFYRIVNEFLEYKYDSLIQAEIAKRMMRKRITQTKMMLRAWMPTFYGFYRRLKLR